MKMHEKIGYTLNWAIGHGITIYTPEQDNIPDALAHYSPDSDTIVMGLSNFHTEQELLSTLYHEYAHSVQAHMSPNQDLGATLVGLPVMLALQKAQSYEYSADRIGRYLMSIEHPTLPYINGYARSEHKQHLKNKLEIHKWAMHNAN